MIRYPTGKKEEEVDIMLKNIGLTRGHRKSAAGLLGMVFKDYQQAERALMSEKGIHTERLADKKRRRK